MPRDAPQKLYLVDGTSQLYRAYFAIRGLTTRDGVPTNAVYGFVTMLRKLLADERPEHVAVAFDLGREVFRHERFADYKAQRPPTPPDLLAQIPYAKRVCEVLGVPRIELEGYEADDVIATAATRAREAGFEVVVVASDKDLYQLVGDGVSVLNPARDERLDAAGVTRRFGVPPERVPDVLGLMGDAVDNIPGVPGVGQKTALAAVTVYGALESVIARAERLCAALDARDRLLAALAELEAEPAASPSCIERLALAAQAASREFSALIELEADAEQRERFDSLRSLVAGASLPSTADAGPPGRRLARPLAALKRELQAADRGSGRRLWTAIRDHADQARLSLELATLRRDAPLAVDPAALVRSTSDAQAAAALFQELEFRSLLASVEGGRAPADAAPAAAPGTTAPAPEVVLEASRLHEVARACHGAERLALAVVEGEGGPHSEVAGLALAHGAGGGWYLPLARRGDEPGLPAEAVREALGPLLSGEATPKVAHDVKAAIHALGRLGLSVAGWQLDVRVAAFLLDAGRASYPLADLVREFLGRELAPGEAAPLAERDAEGTAASAAAVARAVWELSGVLASRLSAEGLSELYRKIDGPLLSILARMEAHGIRVDVERLQRMSVEMEQALERSRAEVHALAGEPFNVDSPKQLREVLFVRLGLRPRRKTPKAREASTDAQTLEELSADHPIAARILEYRELAKLKGTYVDALPRLVDPATGRLHTTFDPAGAATGRLSSADPNLQNIPARTEAGRRIREAFVPDAGCVFLASDYSQIELRVLAHLSQDPELTAAFRAGEDIHRRTAARVFGVDPALVTDEMRRRAKVVNFGILYGMSESRLAREQGIPLRDARAFIETYFARFSRVRDYIDSVREQARRDRQVRTLFGRIRRFPQLGRRIHRGVEEQALRAAVNTTVQGTAADLMKLAMIAVERELGRAAVEARILLQVHDELLIELPEAAAAAAGPLVRGAMEGVWELAVPLVIDQKLGRSWMEVT